MEMLKVVVVPLFTIALSLSCRNIGKGNFGIGCTNCSDAFMCGTLCLSLDRVNDGKSDCFYDEDENDLICEHGRIQCPSHTRLCISQWEICDGVPNCPNKEDERNCDYGKYVDCSQDSNCDNNFTCPMRKKSCKIQIENKGTVTYRQRCSSVGFNNCNNDASCNETCDECDGFVCMYSGECFAKSKRCDSVNDCTKNNIVDFTDELNCCYKPRGFRCEDNCISIDKLCDNIDDGDGSALDESTIFAGCNNIPNFCNELMKMDIEAQAYLETDLEYYTTYVYNGRAEYAPPCKNKDWVEQYLDKRYKYQSMEERTFLAMNYTNCFICIIAWIVGIPLNVLTLIIFFIYVVKNKNVNYLFLLLNSLIDTMNLIVRMTLMVFEQLWPTSLFGETLTYTTHGVQFEMPPFIYLCQVTNFFRSLNQLFCPLILIILAVERLIFIKYPHSAKQWLCCRNRLLLAGIFSLSAITLSTIFAYTAKWDFMNNNSRWVVFDLSTNCVFGVFETLVYMHSENRDVPLYIYIDKVFINTIIELIFTFLSPFLFQLIIYIYIFISSPKASKKLHSLQKRITGVCMVGNFVYFVLSIPFVFKKWVIVRHYLLFLNENEELSNYLDPEKCDYCLNFGISFLHYWLNDSSSEYNLSEISRYLIRVGETVFNSISIINPVIYIVLLSDVKATIKKTFNSIKTSFC